MPRVLRIIILCSRRIAARGICVPGDGALRATCAQGACDRGALACVYRRQRRVRRRSFDTLLAQVEGRRNVARHKDGITFRVFVRSGVFEDYRRCVLIPLVRKGEPAQRIDPGLSVTVKIERSRWLCSRCRSRRRLTDSGESVSDHSPMTPMLSLWLSRRS